MANTINILTKTTKYSDISVVIDDALRSLGIVGSLLLRETYASPWAIAIPDAAELSAMLGVAAGTRVVAFHLVEFGHCEIAPAGSERILLKAGDMAICFGGNAHRLGAGRPTRAQTIGKLLAGEANSQSPDATGGAVGAALLCGVFLLHHGEFNPLLAALPPVMHTELARSGEMHNLSGVARLLAAEIDRSAQGGGYVVERLLEVLCAHVVRAHLETPGSHAPGWFRGVRDHVVGRALAAVHASPAAPWTVPRLASEVAMSPSRFAARFVETVGESPMLYVAKWRMNLACRALASSRTGIERIATEVGYDSAAAFNRAFKKHLGVPPATWRSQVAAR